ncbi:MAG TPA: ArnT family glycosyltransferase [Candidatus Avalokitesvara rifleensis]|uniref:ArnT family glycosyltransferase n=1 Tax=Candidatus Avalokitesvara rifleensis TaxID=3367620 RepID=UPI002712E40D|nr:glycosyltransferase family 39 protein [Candidatus Brocadiales bacterium]
MATPVIGTDCYNFVHAARCFSNGQYLEAMRHGFHPLFPALIALVHSVLGDYEIAGKVISLFFGAITIFPLYFFTRGLFGHRVGVFAAGFLALNPTHVRLSADIMSDPVHIFLFTTAVWLTWVAIERGAWYLYGLVGAVVCLDYLTRTEGMGLLPIILIWFIITNFRWSKTDILQKILRIGVFTIAFVVTASPYLIFIKKDTGHWHYTNHRAVRIIEGKQEAKRPSTEETRSSKGISKEERTPEAVLLARWKETGQYHRIFIHIINEFAKVFYQPLLLFLFIGLFRVTRPRFEIISLSSIVRSLLSCLASLRLRLESFDYRKELFVISIFCIYLIPLYLIAYKSYFISGRYLLPLVVLSFIWAGLGFERLSACIIGSVGWLARPFLYSSRGMLIIVSIVLAVTLPKTVKIKRKYEVSQKEAGYWIKEHHAGSPVIMGEEKVAFYAESEQILMALENYEVLLFHAREGKADYLVFYKEELLQENPELFRRIEEAEDLQFIKEWVDQHKKEKEHLRLYRFVPETKRED